MPVIALSAYAFLATSLFLDDKVAYVYNAAIENSRSLSTQVRTNVKALQTVLNPIRGGADPKTLNFSSEATHRFYNQDLIAFVAIGPIDRPLASWNKMSLYQQLFHDPYFVRFFSQEMTELKNQEVVFTSIPTYNKHYMVLEKINDKLAFAYGFESIDLTEIFKGETLYKNYLVSPARGQISGPELLSEKDQEVFFPIYNQSIPFGVKEIDFVEDKSVFAAFSEVGLGDLILVSIVDRDTALQALERLSAKSALFVIAFVSLMALLSIFASIKLTVPITALMKASEKVSQGQFDVNLVPSSQDEIGELTHRFNQMANQMNELLEGKMEQARLSTELKTVQTLQENLFPKSKAKVATIDINGFFEPASEAGGDWWFYYRKEDKFWLWIGDATGHGAPAAMLTSTARGASALIEYQDIHDPGEALDILNKAIYGVGQGQLMMTFFLVVIDLHTGEMTYANASHEYPYIVPNLNKPVKKKDLTPLVDVRGPRLGQSPTSEYDVSHAKLNKGDTFVLYTDGVIDLEDKDGNEMGERKFLKILCESLSSGAHVNRKMDHMVNEIKKHQGPQTKVDDVTMVMAQFNS